MANKFLMTKNLDDDYETNQLVPEWKNPTEKKHVDPSHEEIEKLADKVPESVDAQMRMATLEAIVDDVVEEALENEPETTEEKIEAEVAPMVEAAMKLAIVPSTVKQMVKRVIGRHMLKRDPRMAFTEKVAEFITNRFVRMEDDAEKIVVEEVLDTKPADVGADIVNETVEHTGDAIQTEGTVPTVPEAIMRNYAIAKSNTRKSSALACRFIAGPQIGRMLYELRYHLPERFKRKYRIG